MPFCVTDCYRTTTWGCVGDQWYDHGFQPNVLYINHLPAQTFATTSKSLVANDCSNTFLKFSQADIPNHDP